MKLINKVIIGVIILIALAASFLIYGLYINPKSPLGHAYYNNGKDDISIRYYRPLKKERIIFGNENEGALVPYGSYWRLGANLTTKIETKTTISFAGRELPSGAYGLYAYPNKENWVIVVHEKTGGFSFAEPDESGVIMKINTASQSLDKSIEKLTIDFVDNYLRIRWDTTQVSIPIN